jgi:hypothetical protein
VLVLQRARCALDARLTGSGGKRAARARCKHPHTRFTFAAIFVHVATLFFSCDKRTIYFMEQQMATLEAFRAVLDDEGTPEIIRNHIIDSLQYALRNYGQVFTSKEVEWLAKWDDARIPLAASRELQKRVAETSR